MTQIRPWDPLVKKRISRRQVLRSGAQASVGAAGLALVGCSDSEDIAELKDQIAELEDVLGEKLDTLVGDETVADPPSVSTPAEPAPTPAPVGYPRITVGRVSELADGEPVVFAYPLQRQSNILVKLGRPAAGGVGTDRDIVAFSELCTHMGCPIGRLFKREHGILGPCVCHFTTFDLTHRGMVVIGQATENLPQVVLELEGDDIIATGVNGIVYGYRDNLAEGEVVVEA